MPEDVARLLVYREDKDWLYFIESVTSVGPMDNKRIVELQELTKNVKSGKIFVTAFLDFKTFGVSCLGYGSVDGRYARPYDSLEW